MGMSQNALPVEGTPFISYQMLTGMNDVQNQLTLQAVQALQPPPQPLPQTLLNVATQPPQQLVNPQQSQQPQTLLLVSSPAQELAIREEAIKQPPVYMITELPTDSSMNGTFVQVPTANIIQMPTIAPACVNLIQVPSDVNVIQVPSNLLVANNNLILCVPPEGFTLQVQQDGNSLTDLPPVQDQVEEIRAQTEKARQWHRDAFIANQAMVALSSEPNSCGVNSKNAKTRRKQKLFKQSGQFPCG